MTKDIKRRSFIKYTAAGVSALALEQYMWPFIRPTNAQDRPYVNRNTGKRVRGVPSTCAGCSAGCGIVAYVHDGQLMKISGNPLHPVTKGSLCLIGQAGLYTLYDPERVLKPMKRAGSRGQGRFAEISWDEANAMVAEKLGQASKNAVVLETRGGYTDSASRRFVKAAGGTLVSHDFAGSPSREKAMKGTFGVNADYPDIENTGYILNFGANPYESGSLGIGALRAMAGRRSSGKSVKLVSFDPRLSATAGRSDEWFRIFPGTDAVVALAMAGVIIKEGLHDKAFISRWTNVSIPKLRAHLSDYTPEAAERISGVRAQDIRRIAVEYATAGRAVLLTGGGVSEHSTGTDNERAVRLLPVITGKLGRPGCNLLPKEACLGRGGPDVASATPWQLYHGMISGERGTDVYIVHGADPVYSSPQPEEIAKLLSDESRVPFIVSMDTHVTDTGRYADLVLPMTTYLEEYALDSAPGPGGEPVLGYRQPVIRPMGASRSYLDALAGIGASSGMELGYRNSEEYVDALAEGWEDLVKDGGVERLGKAGFFHSPKHGKSGTAAMAQLATASGNVEVEWKGASALPSFNPSKHEGTADGEFVLVKYKPGPYREGVTENNLLLKEISHDNMVLMNSAAGREMGLKSRDKVSVSSPAGSIQARVLLVPGLHKNAVAIAAGCGHEGYGNIERAERFKSNDPFTEMIWWENEGSGVNPNRLTPFMLDASSGGQGWMQARVTVKKA